MVYTQKLKYLGRYKRLIGNSANTTGLDIGTIVKMYRIKDSTRPWYLDLVCFHKGIVNSTIMVGFAWEMVEKELKGN
jgi:hypothetical protein